MDLYRIRRSCGSFMTVKFSQNARRFYIGTMSRRALCRCILGNTPPTAACFRDVNDVNNVRCQRCQLRQLRPLSITSMTSTASMTSKHQPPPPAAAFRGGRPPAAAVGGLRRLRLRFWGDACGGGWGATPPVAAFSCSSACGGGWGYAACGGGFF